MNVRPCSIIVMLGASTLLAAAETHAGAVFGYTFQHRILLGSANVTPPEGASDFDSDVVVSQAFADFDETFDLDTFGPRGSAAEAGMFVSQQSSAGPTRITFSTEIDTASVTPPAYACGSNATTGFVVHFTLAEPTQLRLSGVMDGGEAVPPFSVGFVSGNVLLLNAQVQTVFHEQVLDGESAAFDQVLTLPAGNYNFQFECHGGLSNSTPQHSHLVDAASLVVDVVLTVVIEGDIDGDGLVNAADLALLLGSWGPCAECSADLNNDGVVDGADLAVLLGAWN